jgi:hypothetical protein
MTDYRALAAVVVSTKAGVFGCAVSIPPLIPGENSGFLS